MKPGQICAVFATLTARIRNSICLRGTPEQFQVSPCTPLPELSDAMSSAKPISNLSEEAMDKVLRPALMKVGEDESVIPVRGPSKFENDGFIYTFVSEGQIEDFTGIEEIYKGNKLVYRFNKSASITPKFRV
ncbi:MAG: hypothetical protein EOM41_11705 [Bacilli bacterium]|nr:hypothetical protein [Bacilli bacterium]